MMEGTRERALQYGRRLSSVATLYEIDRDDLAETVKACAAASPVWDQPAALAEIETALWRIKYLRAGNWSGRPLVEELRISMGMP